MIQTNNKTYDLEERTFKFAKDVRALIKIIPRNISNIEDGKQIVRSSGSIGANYIEANEALSKKEAKESIYWLRLIDIDDNNQNKERDKLIQEGAELMKIFAAILEKCK